MVATYSSLKTTHYVIGFNGYVSHTNKKIAPPNQWCLHTKGQTIGQTIVQTIGQTIGHTIVQTIGQTIRHRNSSRQS